MPSVLSTLSLGAPSASRHALVAVGQGLLVVSSSGAFFARRQSGPMTLRAATCVPVQSRECPTKHPPPHTRCNVLRDSGGIEKFRKGSRFRRNRKGDPDPRAFVMPPAATLPAACSRLPSCTIMHRSCMPLLRCELSERTSLPLQESKCNDDQVQPSASPRNALLRQRLGAPVERHGRSRWRTRSAAASPTELRRAPVRRAPVPTLLRGRQRVCAREPPAATAARMH